MKHAVHFDTVRPCRRGHAQTTGDIERALPEAKRLCCYGAADGFGSRDCAIEVTAGQHNQEFFSPIAAGRIIGTDAADHSARGFTEYRIAGRMTQVVIDLFEMIQVGHDDGKRSGFALGPLDLTRQDLEHCAAVPHLRQRISRCLQS